MAFTDLRGRMGSEVLILTRAGLSTRGRPKYRYPKNAQVEEGANRMRDANSAWNELDAEQVKAWKRYGERQQRREPITGQTYTQTAKSAFIALATKFLQLNPGTPVPPAPPTETLLPSRVNLSVEAIPGGVRFTAAGADEPDTVTEILYQKLLNVRRSPVPFYKSLAFHHFPPSPQVGERGAGGEGRRPQHSRICQASSSPSPLAQATAGQGIRGRRVRGESEIFSTGEHEEEPTPQSQPLTPAHKHRRPSPLPGARVSDATFDIPLEPGVYAFAYRTVRPSTGQQTLQIKIETIIEVTS